MTGPVLKLSRLPDRTPAKLTIILTPDLKAALDDYAAIYERAYGKAESVAHIIPAMLECFLASDRAFAAARKNMS